MQKQAPWQTNNPHEVLGVTAEASAEDIRKAYLAKIREFPPDRKPEAFEQIRDAYDTLSDPQRRAQIMLTAQPDQRLTEVLKAHTKDPHFVGPERWLEVLKTKTRSQQ